MSEEITPLDIKPAVKEVYCANCVHCQKTNLPVDLTKRDDWEKWLCTEAVKKRNLVSGMPEDGLFVRCTAMRRPPEFLQHGFNTVQSHPGGRCGAEGKLFQPIEKR